MLKIYTFAGGPVRTNSYLVVCTKTLDCIVIDPSQGSFGKMQPIIEQEKLHLTKIVLTHSHWDHIAEASLFVQHCTPEVLVHSEDAGNVEHPGSDGLTFWIPIEPVRVTTFLKEHDVVTVGEQQFTVIHTPGHSPGGICLYNSQEQLLFSGDTLFKGTIGRLDLVTSEPERIWSSLEKLAALPTATKVLSGHGPATTIGSESWLSNAKTYLGG